jgi:hypothetical protein
MGERKDCREIKEEQGRGLVAMIAVLRSAKVEKPKLMRRTPLAYPAVEKREPCRADHQVAPNEDLHMRLSTRKT